MLLWYYDLTKKETIRYWAFYIWNPAVFSTYILHLTGLYYIIL